MKREQVHGAQHNSQEVARARSVELPKTSHGFASPDHDRARHRVRAARDRTAGAHGQKPLKEFWLRPPLALRSHSLRYPWDGQLVNGIQLREAAFVRYLPEYVPSARFYGTWQHDLRQRLLREATRRHAPSELIARASSVLVEPSHGNPHRSHFHVRIYCPPADRPMCLDVGPYWAWYPSAPLALRDAALAPNPR